MAQYVISTLEPANKQPFDVVHAKNVGVGSGNNAKKLDVKLNEIDNSLDSHNKSILNIQNKLGEVNEGNFFIVENIEQRNLLQKKEGIIAYVKNEKQNYQYGYENDELDWHEFNSGNKAPVLKVAEGGHTNNSKIFLSDVPETLVFEFSTTNAGGTSYLYVERDGVSVGQVRINGGSVQFVLKDVPTGTYTYSFSAKDGFQLPSNTITYTVVSGGLKLSSDFGEEIKRLFVYDGEGSPLNTDIAVIYKLDSAYDINNTDADNTNDVKVIEKVTKNGKVVVNQTKTKVNSGTYTLEIPNSGVGTYVVSLTASTKDGDTTISPAPLTYTFNVVSTKDISILIDTSKFEGYYDTNSRVSIPITLAMYDNNSFTVHLTVKNASGTPVEGLSDKIYSCTSGLNSCTIGNLPKGTYSIEVVAYNKDNSISKSATATGLKIVKSDYQLRTHTTDSLIAYYDAYYQSNEDTDSRGKWINRMKNASQSVQLPDINLYGLNYNTNGWMTETSTTGVETNFLKFTGESYGVMNYDLIKTLGTSQLFRNGFTFEILYRTRCIGDLNARVVNCNKYSDKNEIGFNITTDTIKFNSNGIQLNLDFSEDEWTRVSYVVRKHNNGYLMIVYLNGIISKVHALSDISKFDTTDSLLSLNSYKNESGTYSNFGSCEIRNIRIYSKALSSEEIVNNLIADINDKTEQEEKYLQNKVEEGKNKIPIVEFTTKTPKQVNGQNKNIFEYLNSLPKEKASTKIKMDAIVTYKPVEGAEQIFNFAQVALQGTSSLEYPIRNYRLYLYESLDENPKQDKYGNNIYNGKTKFSPKEDWIPESKFTLKCDYMESSHMNNIGTADWVDGMYKTWASGPALTPPQKKAVDEDGNTTTGYRTSIQGFPILLKIDGYTVGTFTFNVDKDAPTTYGFKEENPVLPDNHNLKVFSYEVTANSGISAGAFNKWTQEWSAANKNITEEEYYNNDFEIRYIPDEENTELATEGLKCLKKLVEWVSDADDKTFRNEFNQHLDLKFCIDYFLQVLTFGMVDSFGKNCMWNTWDGEIWYPSFYDMDTMLGLTNSGLDNIPCDIELPDLDDDDDHIAERFKRFNTNKSKLWRKLQRVFSTEIKARYAELRKSYFTWDNFKANYLDKISLFIGEYYYNLNAETKYIPFPSYQDRANGNRVQRVKRWVTERLAFTDTLFGLETSETHNTIMLRVNPKGTHNFRLKVKTYSPVYLSINYRNSQDGTGGKTDPIYCTKGTFENKDMSTSDCAIIDFPIYSDKDQEVYINCANYIMEISGLQDLNLSRLEIDYATRLTNVDVTESSISEIKFGENKYLTNLNLSNCNSLSAAVDLSNCPNIKYVDCTNSPITGITIPTGGSLKSLKLDNTRVAGLALNSLEFLSSISIVNCNYIGTFSATKCTKIQKIDLRNTSIYSFAVDGCDNLLSILLDGCTKLASASFEKCYKVDTLQVNECTLLPSLDVSTLYALTTLRCNNTTALKEIILPRFINSESTTRWNKLERFAIKASGILRLRYGVGSNVLADGKLDFEPLTRLKGLFMPQCKKVNELVKLTIIPRESTSENLSSVNVSECSSLAKISGNIACEDVTAMFLKCGSLTDLTNKDLVLDFTRCTSLNSIAQESVINLASAQKIMNACGEKLTSCYAAFNLSYGMTGTLPSTFFDKTPNINKISIMFRGSRLTTIAEGAFDNLTKLEDAEWVFRDSSNNLTKVPISLFNHCTKLKNLHDAFYGCSKMYFVDSEGNKTTTITDLFKGLSALETIDTAFYKCIALEVTDITDLFKDTVNLKTASATFSGCKLFKAPIPNYLFSKCSSLTNIAMMFENCDLSTNSLPDYLFTDSTKTVKLQNLDNIAGLFTSTHIQGTVKKELFVGAENVTEMGRYTINLKPEFVGDTQENNYIYSSGLFANCDITVIYDDFLSLTPEILSIKEMFMGCSKLSTTYVTLASGDGYEQKLNNNFSINFFKNNPKLVDARRVFKGCTSLLGNIPADLLKANVALNDISGMFDGCSNNGKVESGIFKYNTKLTNISNVFANNGTITGEIPEDLLSTLTELENVSYLFSGSTFKNSIPKNLFLYNTKIKKMDYTFSNCLSLTGSIPSTLLSSCVELESCVGLFKNCNKLSNGDSYTGTIVPSTLFNNNTLLKDVSDVFNGCTALNGLLPNTLFSNNIYIESAYGLFNLCAKLTGTVSYSFLESEFVENVNSIFNGTKLTKIENLDSENKYFLYKAINAKKLEKMSKAFLDCSSLTGTVHSYWNDGIESHSQTFSGCTALANYSQIDPSWK